MGLFDRLRGPAGPDRPGADRAPQSEGADDGPDEQGKPPAARSGAAGESEPTEPPTAARPEPRRSHNLVRHSPFSVGFFGALGAVTAIFLAQQLQSISSILILLVMALFLAIGLNPLVEWFMGRGAHRGVAVLVVLAMVLTVFVLFVVSIAPVISDQIALITENAPRWLRELRSDDTVQQLDDRFDVIGKAESYVSSGDFGQQAFGGALGVGLAVVSALANTLIVLVLMIYFLASLPGIKHALYRLAPASRRPRVSDLGDRIIRSTGAYVAGAFLVAVCAGLSTLVFTFIVGLGDYAFALAFVVGLLSLIPVVGAFISGALITALALTVSPTVALITLIYYIAYQQLEAYLIYPRIMARSVEVPGAVTVIAALVGGGLLGIIGAVLAVPVAAALLLLHREVFLTRQDAR
jgi:predicted PurR-regulated permease PerM